jgi:hypothetical protein
VRVRGRVRWLSALSAAVLLFPGLAWSHSTGKKNLKPSKAAADLKRARQFQKDGKAAEFSKVMLACKRTLAGERRYSCCIRGGCNECAFEQECSCGANLTEKLKPGEKRKGVCQECWAGWKAGRGLYDGINPDEITVSPMDSSMMPYLSGTSLRPVDQPMYMTHSKVSDWSVMTMGQGHLVYTAQSTARGGEKLFAPNWIMPMASRQWGRGTLTLRSMLSLDPATITGRRYPLLFQAGETAYGKPLADGQHPHDLFIELAAQYTLPVGERTSLMVYGGPRGEPALGPPAFPHRLSASENPMAVLGHHYQDATHIANNVVTVGVTHRRVTFEVSGFNGREPDERRWNLEKGRMDAWSTRVTVQPTSRWAIQFSGGALPEGPRVTASAQHVRPLSRGYLASTLVWGQDRSHGLANSYLAESTLRWKKHWAWGRAERTDRDSTLRFVTGEPTRIGQVSALTLGYGHDLPSPARWLSASMGGQVMLYRPSASLRADYSATPVGAQVFLRFRLDTAR